MFPVVILFQIHMVLRNHIQFFFQIVLDKGHLNIIRSDIETLYSLSHQKKIQFQNLNYKCIAWQCVNDPDSDIITTKLRTNLNHELYIFQHFAKRKKFMLDNFIFFLFEILYNFFSSFYRSLPFQTYKITKNLTVIHQGLLNIYHPI